MERVRNSNYKSDRNHKSDRNSSMTLSQRKHIGRRSMRATWDDRIFDFLCNASLVFFVIITFYPVYFVVVASFTDSVYVNNGDVLLYPKKLELDGYLHVFSNSKVWTCYGNTIIYTVGGVLLGVTVVMMAGYALSRKDLLGKGAIMKILVFTMYFGGGLIPTFLIVSGLGLVNTRLIMIILGSVSVYNIIVVRSFMMANIPNELFEAATIDGCGNGIFFLKVVLPLSKAVMAVMVLYIGVGHWNSYFNAMVYLTDSDKAPLQLYLREMLLLASSLANVNDPSMDPEYLLELQKMAQVLKYALIVVATAPIMCLYPFVQKYFMKGVLIGSIKG